MSLKKIIVSAVAAIASTGQIAPVQVSAAAPIETQAKRETAKPTHQTRSKIFPNGFGGIYDHSEFGIMTPKLYGQYLQQNRLQKWTKSKAR